MSWWNNAFDNIFSGGAGQGYGDMMNQIRNGMGYYQGNFNNAMNGMMPWLQTGQNELGTYQKGVNAMQDPNFINNMMQQYQSSPLANLQQQQGLQAMNNQAAASGQLGSTAAAKGLDNYAQQVSSGDMNQYLQNRLGAYNNFLQGAGNIAGMGQQAANTMGGWGMQAGSDMANMYNNLGTAQAGQDVAHGMGIDNLFSSMSPLFKYMQHQDPNGMQQPFTGSDAVGGFDMSKLMSMLGMFGSML